MPNSLQQEQQQVRLLETGSTVFCHGMWGRSTHVYQPHLPILLHARQHRSFTTALCPGCLAQQLRFMLQVVALEDQQ
jgi:hypothetical protein